MKHLLAYLLTMILFFTLIISCKGEAEYTYEELQSFTDQLNPYGTYFWDEFPLLEKQFSLTAEESKLLGAWSGLDFSSVGTYYFFPNRLFYISLKGHKYWDEEHKYLDSIIGLWSIKNSELFIRIIGYLIYEDGQYKYNIFETPYLDKIIDTDLIDPIGYTKKPMNIIDIPDSLKIEIESDTMKYKPVNMVRSLYSIHAVGVKRGEDPKHYGYFKYVPIMAERNLTGEQIATTPELVYEFFTTNP